MDSEQEWHEQSYLVSFSLGVQYDSSSIRIRKLMLSPETDRRGQTTRLQGFPASRITCTPVIQQYSFVYALWKVPGLCFFRYRSHPVVFLILNIYFILSLHNFNILLPWLHVSVFYKTIFRTLLIVGRYI